MIDEDGIEFVDCSDEKTVSILSSDDGDELEDIEPLPNPILMAKQYGVSKKFQGT